MKPRSRRKPTRAPALEAEAKTLALADAAREGFLARENSAGIPAALPDLAAARSAPLAPIITKLGPPADGAAARLASIILQVRKAEREEREAADGLLVAIARSRRQQRGSTEESNDAYRREEAALQAAHERTMLAQGRLNSLRDGIRRERIASAERAQDEKAMATIRGMLPDVFPDSRGTLLPWGTRPTPGSRLKPEAASPPAPTRTFVETFIDKLLPQ